MKKKEGILIVLILVLLVIGIGIFIIMKNKNNSVTNEYIPQEEISDEQLRQTIITLYFKNKETGEITNEARKVDVSALIKDPYNYLLEELINGPKNNKLEKTIPEGTKVNSTKLEGDTLIIDFSREFIENAPTEKEEQQKILKGIVNTLTELTEVNYVKILIDGEEGKGFTNSDIIFNEKIKRII